MASKLVQVLLLTIVASISAHVISASRDLRGSGKGSKVEGIHDAKIYLQRYGYLANDVQTNDESFDEALESAIKSYQTFFKLNVSGILDGDTLAQMSRPRCGVSDNFNESMRFRVGVGGSYFSFFPHKRKWPSGKSHLTYAFINNYPTKFVTPVVRAFDNWESHTSIFTFSQAVRAQSADIAISFERGDHGDGFPFAKDGVLAHAFGPIDGRVHFNSDENWTEGAHEVEVGEYDLESVALHELGHILGLGHSADREAVMWPDLYSGVTRLALQPDDIEGIRALYS